MKTFDYEKAWLELALPAFKQLPENITTLAAKVGEVAADLRQDNHCLMIWPNDGGKLRAMFEAIPSEELSNAANVVYYYNHWRPAASVAGDAPFTPCVWKFSNYADQVLRARFNLDGRGESKATVDLQIHEGKIRVCYSSRDSWTWHEVAPATEAGMETATKIAGDLRRKLEHAGKSFADRDSVAFRFMENLKATTCAGWDTSSYMVEESELELRRAARMPKPDKARLIAKIEDDYAKSVESLTTERDGMLWLVNHDLPIGNCIYYNHTGRFCFGWRTPLVGKAREQLLKAVAKFQFPYDVK